MSASVRLWLGVMARRRGVAGASPAAARHLPAVAAAGHPPDRKPPPPLPATPPHLTAGFCIGAITAIFLNLLLPAEEAMVVPQVRPRLLLLLPPPLVPPPPLPLVPLILSRPNPRIFFPSLLQPTFRGNVSAEPSFLRVEDFNATDAVGARSARPACQHSWVPHTPGGGRHPESRGPSACRHCCRHRRCWPQRDAGPKRNLGANPCRPHPATQPPSHPPTLACRRRGADGRGDDQVRHCRQLGQRQARRRHRLHRVKTPSRGLRLKAPRFHPRPQAAPCTPRSLQAPLAKPHQERHDPTQRRRRRRVARANSTTSRTAPNPAPRRRRLVAPPRNFLFSLFFARPPAPLARLPRGACAVPPHALPRDPSPPLRLHACPHGSRASGVAPSLPHACLSLRSSTQRPITAGRIFSTHTEPDPAWHPSPCHSPPPFAMLQLYTGLLHYDTIGPGCGASLSPTATLLLLTV